LGWDAMAPDTSSKVRYLPSAALLDSISPTGMHIAVLDRLSLLKHCNAHGSHIDLRPSWSIKDEAQIS
jgi:hypothetical protein